MFLSEFFMPVTVVAFLITFGRYFSANWFGIFMPIVVGLELLLFATTGGVKHGELADQFKSSSQANKELQAARQRNATQAEQSGQQGDETKKTPANAKQEKVNAKKAAQAEKTAAASATKKTK